MKLEGKAHAKINLSLRITGVRPNGYHDLETIMLKLDLADRVQLEISKGWKITAEVPARPELNSSDNLACRAAKMFCDELGLEKKIHIVIDKKIPLGGGLGGGSSDAAVVFKLLHAEFPGMSESRLKELATRLGADIPFLLQDAPLALAKGIGEELFPLPNLPRRNVVLLNPGFPVSTPEAYAAYDRRLTNEGVNDNCVAALQRPENWSDLDRLIGTGKGNDLQIVVEEMFPEIAKARQRLLEEGAQSAQMSGSGATVFGLFDDRALAERVCENVRELGHAIFTTTIA